METHAIDDELTTWALRARTAEAETPEWPPRRGMLCPIDLCSLRPGDVAIRLPCGHVAHSECILPYLRAHPRNRPRYCPLDGVEVPNTLSATRMRVVTAYDPFRSEVQFSDEVSDEDYLRWMDAALSEMETIKAERDSTQLEHLSARSSSLLARRNAYLLNFRSTTLPPEEPISVSGQIHPVCDNPDGCTSGSTVNSLPCAHWLCHSCDSPRQTRCMACCALRPTAARPVRWSLTEAVRRENRRIRCGELAMQRIENQVQLVSRRHGDLQRRYGSLLSISADDNRNIHDLALRFESLMHRFRVELNNPFSPSESLPEIAIPETIPTRSPEITVPTPSSSQISSELEAWTPPSPGGSPTEGMSNLIVGLRHLLIGGSPRPLPQQPQPQPQQIRDNQVSSTSPVSDDDSHVCVICLSEIERGERVIRLPCMHVFHADCILGYLRSAPRPQCPLDRSEIPRRTIDSLPIFKWGEPDINNSNLDVIMTTN